jgi:heme/copper-type cytochrome/quinol oxidase subunit 2
MNLLSFLSFLILGITLLTMVFGVVAYFLYKARERKKGATEITYEEALEAEGTEMLFFTRE